LSWLDVERHNLMAAVAQAADGDWKRSGWLLADAICGYFGFHGSPRESVTIASSHAYDLRHALGRSPPTAPGTGKSHTWTPRSSRSSMQLVRRLPDPPPPRMELSAYGTDNIYS
jgi:hypothetical protein